MVTKRKGALGTPFLHKSVLCDHKSVLSDAAAQARRCFEIVQSAIKGGKLSDVLRTRILSTRIEDWEQVGGVHGEFFGSAGMSKVRVFVIRWPTAGW